VSLWTEQDLAALRALDAGLGGISMIEAVEENRMTEQAPEGFTGDDGDDGGWGEATGKDATFPERPDNPHESPLSVNFKPAGAPQLTVRGRTVQEHMELLEQVQSSGLLGLIQSVNSLFGGSGGTPAPQAPAPAAQQPWNQQPAQQFPNQPFPGQPAWQTTGAPQAPAQQGWGGGAPQQGGGNRQGPKPRPNWPQVYKVNVPFNSKDTFKAFREQNKEVLKGKVAWAGGGDYWVEGSVVQGFAQYNPVPA
jgi:hypothetical protein